MQHCKRVSVIRKLCNVVLRVRVTSSSIGGGGYRPHRRSQGGAQVARPPPPPIKIPLTTKSYDNIASRCLVAVFFSNYAHNSN